MNPNPWAFKTRIRPSAQLCWSSPKIMPRFHAWQSSLNNPFAATFFVAELRIPMSNRGICSSGSERLDRG